MASLSPGLAQVDAREFFINNKQITSSEASIKLAFNVHKALILVSNDKIRSQLKTFISHCRTPYIDNNESAEIHCFGALRSLTTH